jgi:hypothetical protein
VAGDERDGSGSEPGYAVFAYLQYGRFAVIAAVLAVLYERGLVDAGRSGTVRRTDEVRPPTETLERTVWLALHGSVSPGALMARPSVDACLNELRHEAIRAGLVHPFVPVRSFVPARTHRGRLSVDEALAGCPWPPSPESADAPVEQRVGMTVALYGDTALVDLMPEFARAGGLSPRTNRDVPEWADPGPTGGGYG